MPNEILEEITDAYEDFFMREELQVAEPREKPRANTSYEEEQDEIDEKTGMPKGIRVAKSVRKKILAYLNKISMARRQGISGHVTFPDGTIRAATPDNLSSLAGALRDDGRYFEDDFST